LRKQAWNCTAGIPAAAKLSDEHAIQREIPWKQVVPAELRPTTGHNVRPWRARLKLYNRCVGQRRTAGDPPCTRVRTSCRESNVTTGKHHCRKDQGTLRSIKPAGESAEAVRNRSSYRALPVRIQKRWSKCTTTHNWLGGFGEQWRIKISRSRAGSPPWGLNEPSIRRRYANAANPAVQWSRYFRHDSPRRSEKLPGNRRRAR